MYIKQNLFTADKRDIYTVELHKKAFGGYDNKRFILDGGVNTLAWGHYSISIDRNSFPEVFRLECKFLFKSN